MTLLLLQTAIGDYRLQVTDEVYKKVNGEFQIIVGKDYFYSYSSINEKLDRAYIKRCKNVFFFGRRLLLQIYDFRLALAASVVIVEFNPRIINSWLVLGARRVLRRHTVLWGHAWARSGKLSKSELVRRQMKRLATAFLAYTRTEQREIADEMPGKLVVSAPNALYRSSEMLYSGSMESRKSFLYVGRLVAEKKIDILLHGYAAYRDSVSHPAYLRIVGHGPEADRLRRLADDLGIDTVLFEGHIGDRTTLEKFYREAIVSLSPGYVGLSLIQSLSFGIPMIISKNEPHAPEIEAASEDFTARFFETDNSQHLAAAMAAAEESIATLHAQGPQLVEFCRENYSVEAMAEGILNAVDGSLKR